MRTKPYTELGIKRIPCSRCGKPSVHQWQICADGNQYRGVCKDCDIQLNDYVMMFMRIPNRQEKIERYIARNESHNH
jgi:hypothetical protein